MFFLTLLVASKDMKWKRLKIYFIARHGDYMKYHIGVLKSLIKPGGNGAMALHDLVEDMGKEIVRQESPKDPGK